MTKYLKYQFSRHFVLKYNDTASRKNSVTLDPLSSCGPISHNKKNPLKTSPSRKTDDTYRRYRRLLPYSLRCQKKFQHNPERNTGKLADLRGKPRWLSGGCCYWSGLQAATSTATTKNTLTEATHATLVIPPCSITCYVFVTLIGSVILFALGTLLAIRTIILCPPSRVDRLVNTFIRSERVGEGNISSWFITFMRGVIYFLYILMTLDIC